MKCPKCGKDVILQKKQVGVDENGNPVIIYHARDWDDSYPGATGDAKTAKNNGILTNNVQKNRLLNRLLL